MRWEPNPTWNSGVQHGAPADSEYAVDPVGEAMINPSALWFETNLPPLQHATPPSRCSAAIDHHIIHGERFEYHLFASHHACMHEGS